MDMYRRAGQVFEDVLREVGAGDGESGVVGHDHEAHGVIHDSLLLLATSETMARA